MVFSKCFYWLNAKSASACFLGVLQPAPRDPLLYVCFEPRASLCTKVSQLLSSPSIYPVPLDSADSPGAHLCVQTPQGLGAQLKHIAHKHQLVSFCPNGKDPSSLAIETIRFTLFATIHSTSFLGHV